MDNKEGTKIRKFKTSSVYFSFFLEEIIEDLNCFYEESKVFGNVTRSDEDGWLWWSVCEYYIFF